MFFHSLIHGCVENFFKKMTWSNKRAARKGGSVNFLQQLASHFFQQLLIDIEIGVDVLHIILILQRFH